MASKYRRTEDQQQDPERTISAINYTNDTAFKEDLERLVHPERRLRFKVKHVPTAHVRSWVLLSCMIPPQRQWARVIRHEHEKGGALVAVLEASECPPNLDESTLAQPAEAK